MLKPIAALVTGLTILVGCTSLSLYYKEGESVERLNRDEAICETEALRVVPVDNRTRIVPGTRIPQTFCDAAGLCQTILVQTTPDRIETYDANRQERLNYLENCMITKGYERVRIPACSEQVVESTPLAATRILPPLTEASCGIRLKSGRWQIVTP